MIALLDCNSFFASCEIAFRPWLRHRPVVVLSNNDGCIVAANSIAKQLGIEMFGPYFKCREQLLRAQGVAFSAHFELYQDMSRRVFQCVRERWPSLQIYSVDECFIPMKGNDLQWCLEQLEQLRRDVYQYTGIPVSIGLAPTKVLAKVANDLAKKSHALVAQTGNGFFYLSPAQREAILNIYPVERVWGIGRQSSIKLRALGFYTAGDFLNKANAQQARHWLALPGEKIYRELLGDSCMEEEDFASVSGKQLMVSRTLPEASNDPHLLKSKWAGFCEKAAAKLRAQSLSCLAMTVYARTNRFAPGPYHRRELQTFFTRPTQDTAVLLKHCLGLVDQLISEQIPYKKLGIILHSLCDDRVEQLSFLSSEESVEVETNHQSRIELMKTLDLANKRFGKGTLTMAATQLSSLKKTTDQEVSQGYFTTRWDHLPVVNLK